MKNIVAILLFVTIAMSAVGQTYTMENIRNLRVRNSGEIIQNNQVTGYFIFYDLERTNARLNNYMLKVLDENLNEINSVTIQRTMGFVILEASYNGKAFVVLGFDGSKNLVELIAYDEKLQQIASSIRLIKGSNMLNAYGAAANGNETEQDFVVPVANEGFLLYTVTEHRKAHYHIEFLDNMLKTKWMDEAPDDAGFEIAFEAFQDSETIGTLIERRKRAGSKDIEYDLLVNSADDGRRLFKVPVVLDNGYTVAVSDVRHDTVSGDFIVFGEFYAPSARETRDRSEGFMSVVYDATGKLKAQKPSTWAAMSNVTPLDAKGKFDGSNTSILFHNTVRTSDGQIFVIGEQYKKAASAGGIALTIAAAALGANASASVTQINIYNLVVFQFNPDYTINKVHVFDKKKSVMQLPAGALETSPKAVSHYAKAWGAFDYRFTQMSADQSTFLVTYVDYDRSQTPTGTAFVVGSVVYTPEKTFVTDKFTLRRRSTQFSIMKAKPGYILVSEYFRKEKRFESRLEKVNF